LPDPVARPLLIVKPSRIVAFEVFAALTTW